MCTETGEEVAFGSDPYYNEIIADRKGRKFEEQRDNWKEGTDFDFEANFYGKTEDAEADADDSISSKVVDTEIVA